MILSSFASLFKTWWTLQLAVSCVSFLQLLILFIVPESPRWLISVGRLDQAESVLKTIATKNGKEDFVKTFKIQSLSQETESIKDNSKETLGIKDLFNRKIIVFTLVQMVTWPAVALGYFGWLFSSHDLHCFIYV